MESNRISRVGALTAVLAALALFAALPVSASAHGGLGVPTDSSLLFSLDSKGGTLKAVGKPAAHQYTLTLNGVGRYVTWFADRPRRDAGRLGPHGLFADWGGLGFRSSPPNAALVVSGARADEDTMALVLRLRHYDPRKRTATFAARGIGSLGGGLHHLSHRLDPRVPSHFRNASLFIDNGYFYAGCTTGRPELFAIEASALRAQGAELVGFVAAEGQRLSTQTYLPLADLLGSAFGGEGNGAFAVADIPAPARGTSWYMCAEGTYPLDGEVGGGLIGEVAYFPNSFVGWAEPEWLPADGRELQGYRYGEYDEAFAGSTPTFALPKVPAPAGMTAMVNVGGSVEFDGAVGQLRMFVSPPRDGEGGAEWVPAAGQTLGSNEDGPLIATLQAGAGLRSDTAKVPEVPDPAPGVGVYLAVSGYFPFGE